MFKRFTLFAALLTLAACHGQPLNKNLEFGSQYWQRVHVSEAAFLQGAKAQQMLNRDVAQCVTELRELERLGGIRDAIPTDQFGRALDPDDKLLRDHNAPERTGYLLSEMSNYQDFDSCMLYKGWERVDFVPFDASRKAKDTYLKYTGQYEYEVDPDEFDDDDGWWPW